MANAYASRHAAGVDDLAVGVDEGGAVGAEDGPDDGMPVGVGFRHELVAAIVEAVAGPAPQAVADAAGDPGGSVRDAAGVPWG